MDAKDVIRKYGTITAAAKALGVTRVTVYNWLKRGIPALRQLHIEKVTKGKLKAAPDSVA